MIEAGEKWYARINNAPSIATVKILEVTQKTILVEAQGKFFTKWRLEPCNIEFIEEITNPHKRLQK